MSIINEENKNNFMIPFPLLEIDHGNGECELLLDDNEDAKFMCMDISVGFQAVEASSIKISNSNVALAA